MQGLVAVFNLMDDEFSIFEKELYSYSILMLEPFNLFKTEPDVGIIICDFNTEINKVFEIIRKLRRIEATIVIFSKGEHCKELENVFVLEYQDFNDIYIFLKYLDTIYQMFSKNCIIDINIRDIFNFLLEAEVESDNIIMYDKKDVPFEEIFSIVKKDFENDNRKFKRLLISIRLGNFHTLMDAYELISHISDILGVKNLIFQICIDEKIDNNISLQLILSYSNT